MSLKADIANFVQHRLVEPFVDKPGMNLPADLAQETLTVKGGLKADHWQETFIQKGAVRATSAAGKILDMTPEVKGGIKAGDVVLRDWSVTATAESGFLTTLTNFLRTGKWQPIRSNVSHAAMVVKDPAHGNELRVIQWVDDPTPPEQVAKMTWLQKKLGGTFLQNVSLDQFFNTPGAPITETKVMRPNSASLAATAAKSGLALFNTQFVKDASGKVIAHPWYPHIPHSLAPDGRGGVCSTMVNKAFGFDFKVPLHLPITPEHFAISPELTMVDQTTVTKVEAK